MSYILVDYKGLQVVSPDPVGDGGLALNSNFRTVADYMEDPDFSLVKIYGSTSGYIGLRASAIAGSTTYTLPSADGTSGQALVTNGSGVLSFSTVVTPPGGSSGYVQFNNGSGGFGGDSGLFWDHSTARLGIGTVVPSTDIDIYNGNVNAGHILIGHTRAASLNTIYLNGRTGADEYNLMSSANDYNLYIGRPSGGNIFIGENGAYQMAIQASTGNVGIGTTTPHSKLEITDVNKSTGDWPNLGIITTDSMAVDKGGFLALGGSYTGTSATTFSGIVGRKENSTGGNSAGYLAFLTNDNSTGLPERMRITSTGNVGIGTATPTTNLQVAQGTTGVGTVSVSGTAVTGVSTQFLNTFKVGDTITVTTTSGVETKAITVVNNDTSLTTAAFAGTAAAGTGWGNNSGHNMCWPL